MEQTLALIARHDPIRVEEIIKSGKILQTESGIKYVLIQE
jgi:hypothetical protein